MELTHLWPSRKNSQSHEISHEKSSECNFEGVQVLLIPEIHMVMLTVCLQRPILLKDIALTFIKTVINYYLSLSMK